MPEYPNFIIKDWFRIRAEFEIARDNIERATNEFGFPGLVNDPELQALGKKFSGLCYPFLKGFQEVNKEFDAWFKKQLQPKV